MGSSNCIMERILTCYTKLDLLSHKCDDIGFVRAL